MKNNKGLWIVLIVILVILIIWGIVSAYNHSAGLSAEQGNLTPSGNQSSANGGTGSSANTGVTASNGGTVSNKKAPTLSALNPMSGKAGTLVAINGSRFTSTNNTVKFSGFILTTTGRSSDGIHLSITIPDSLRACNGGTCSDTAIIIEPGSYPIVVTNANGTSNTIYYVVTQSGPSH